jgi:WD40 repeat protein
LYLIKILLHTLKAKDGGDLTGVAWNYASDRFMLASASHDGTVRLWTTPDPRRVLEYEAEPEAEPEPEPEDTSHEPRSRRQETMTTEGTAAHSSSGRSTPAPYSDEPQSMETYMNLLDEVDARLGVQHRRVDSPLYAEFDTSRPPQPNYFRQV